MVSMFFALIIFTAQLTIISGAKMKSLVEVYDNVLNQDTAHWLHEECIKWSKSDLQVHDKTWLSLFPLEHPERHSPVQQLLDQILRELYPDVTEPTYHVEFWSRTQWSHIWGHQDLDEAHERATAHEPSTPVKHPETGHVMYLKLGEKVKGPTVVWNATKGGELMSLEPGTFADMITVPAVEGRLLRFQGQLLHGVPRPYDVYWSHVFELDEEPEFERSVILFNTWRINNTLDDVEILQGKENEEEFDSISKSCNPKVDWKPVKVVDHPLPEQNWLESMLLGPFKEMEVPMMGNERRRGMGKRAVVMEAPLDASDAFQESSKVSRISIRPSKLRIFGYEL